MRRLRKTIAVVLAALMLLTCAAFSNVASAADGGKVSVTYTAKNSFFGDITRLYSKGDTFDATVMLQSDKLVMNSQFNMYFDHTKLHATAMTALGGGMAEKYSGAIKNFSDTLQENDDMVTANFSASVGVFEYMQKTEVLKVSFEVLDDSEPVTLTLDYYNLSVDGTGEGGEYIKLIDRSKVDSKYKDTFSVDGALSGGTEPVKPTEPVTETDTETVTETVTETATETATETVTETVTEIATEPSESTTETQPVTESVTESQTSTETASETQVSTETATDIQAPTETVSETEPFTEPVTEPAAPAAKLNKKTLKLSAGKTYTLKVTNGKAKSFKSSKKSVATVSKSGKITALKKGTANITATLTDGTKLTCKLTVKSNPTLKVGGKKLSAKKTYALTAKKPLTVTIGGKAKSVKNKYAVSKKVVKVVGKTTATKIRIKALKKGKATVTVKVNGVMFKIKVKVK